MTTKEKPLLSRLEARGVLITLRDARKYIAHMEQNLAGHTECKEIEALDAAIEILSQRLEA